MSAAQIKKAAAAIEAALEAAEAAGAADGRDKLLEALRAAADLAARAGSDVAPLRSAIEVVASRAMVLATDGHADLGLIGHVARARDACLDPPDHGAIDGLPDPPIDREPTFMGSRGAPSLKQRKLAPLDEGDEPQTIELAPVILPVPVPMGAPADDEAPAPPVVIELPEDPRERPKPPRPPVVLAPPEPPVSMDAFHALVVDQGLEMVAALGRDRSSVPFGDRGSLEARILRKADAVLCAGDRVARSALAWWDRSLASPSPWGSWAAVLALGCLSGTDALRAVKRGVERLPHDADDHAAPAAEALAVAPHPHALALARDLLASPHPVARAIGLDTLSRRGAASPDLLRGKLLDPSLPIVAAAARGVSRLGAEDAAPLLPLLRRWMYFPHPKVAYPIARALLRWGITDPWIDVQGGGRLAGVLGAEAAEIVILSGSADDLPLLESILKRSPPSAPQMSALARFGHAAAWAYLLHRLGDEDLADDAADALTTLFGARVAPDERLLAPAWKSAILALAPVKGTRYRRGEPWRPAIVVSECASGELSAREMEGRLDELAVRAGAAAPVDLSRFLPEVEPALAAAYAAGNRADKGYSPGSW